MRHTEAGITLVELAAALGILAVAIGVAAPALGRALTALRVDGAAQVLYGAVHETKARARATGVMHALRVERDGRTFRIVQDPGGVARTVTGPAFLPEGVVAEGNVTLRFSPKGFAVPMGTITVRAGDEVRRVIVNILGRVRIAAGAR